MVAAMAKAIGAKARARSAVVKVKGAPPSGQKFPIPDKAHAKAALARIDQAKPPLTGPQKAAVRKKAATKLGKKVTGVKQAAAIKGRMGPTRRTIRGKKGG
jgi:hypothetical protein